MRRETVWKIGVGTELGLRGPPRGGGGAGASIGRLLCPRTRARSPSEYFPDSLWKVNSQKYARWGQRTLGWAATLTASAEGWRRTLQAIHPPLTTISTAAKGCVSRLLPVVAIASTAPST
jgi:hypothetical protein